MSSAKQSPKVTTEIRQDKDKREYDRLIKEIKEALEHRSPGFWDWLDDVVDTVGGAIDDGLDWVNDVVDTYIWDTTEDEGNVEEWIHDTFDEPVEAVVDVVTDVVDDVNSWIDEYIWDTTEDESVIEQWIHDTFDDPAEAVVKGVNDAVGEVNDWVDDYIWDTTEDEAVVEKWIDETVVPIVESAGDIINNIGLALGVGFDAAMAAIGSLPSLIIGWHDELVNFFNFDLEKFATMWKETEAKIRGIGE